MSGYPIVLEGTTIRALVVGGGAVGARKARALLDAGAAVEVVSPRISDALADLGQGNDRLRITTGAFAPGHLDGKTLVYAATDDAAVNAEVARSARDRGIAVSVADAPEIGTFVTPAVHRAGDIVVAITAGGVPKAAARIRDAIAGSIDERYAAAVQALGGLRRSLIDAGDRDRWQQVSSELLGPSFVDDVDSGAFAKRLDEWR